MLIPPPEPADVTVLTERPPLAPPEWLDDGAFVDPDAQRAAIEREQYGSGPVRLLTSLIAVNAVLEYAHSPAKKDDEKKPRPPEEPTPIEP